LAKFRLEILNVDPLPVPHSYWTPEAEFLSMDELNFLAKSSRQPNQTKNKEI
jgi:hypothetical protein